jgi:hypothetical protein
MFSGTSPAAQCESVAPFPFQRGHMKHHPQKRHGHKRRFLLVLLRTEASIRRFQEHISIIIEGHMANKQLLANATKGFVLTLAESFVPADGSAPQSFPLTAGPFTVDVQDPASTIAVVPGTPDQKTPTIFRPNGTLAVGTVTVNVTDTSNGLKGSVSFDVVAPAPPPPPPAPNTLAVDVAPEP